MQICVCGWYFRPDFYALMREVNKKYSVTVINHQDTPLKWEYKLSWHLCPNIGLEWGAYDFFLKTAWDGESAVLFLHDDIRFRPVIKNYELIEPIIIFDTIEQFEFDQVYFFGSLEEATKNYGIHGRAFKCSAVFLKSLLEQNNGFWYDENNDGHIQGTTPNYCEHYNKADYKFADFIKELKCRSNGLLDAGHYVILPALDCAVRGRFREEIEGVMDDEN
ncbi:MAG: hypothetical protein JRD68_00075 [Deltaproteobacteria bacterium]|nr:hypothetical protein [Deltaproteobacteria bacterium]